MGRARALVGKYFLECSVVTAPRRLSRWRSLIAARARGIGFLLPTLVLQACFDVHQIDPGNGRFVIDDFEDGDTLPKTPLFQRWDCYTFNLPVGKDPAQTVHCDVERPGDESGYALSASFALHDQPDGKPDNGGAALSTTADPMVDLNGYKTIVFSLKVDFGTLPSASYAYIALDCNSVAAENQKQAGDYFQLTNDVKPIVAIDTWKKFPLALSDLTQPDWQKNRFADGPKACLAAVDSVNFEISGQLADGQAANGVIHIDDVYLE